ncbi:MAG TPA: mannose-6-phosphate isomerase, class I [Ilumatobacteraceae bacterium]|nr:mannose-6-phosphate isomerase, class I [Ilumatobacteraceae bacterium]
MSTAPIPVEGVVQHYAWGDPTFIPELLGVAADGRPWAELWLGTHPNGPAITDDGRPLRELTGGLPYLLKVLAAAEPLSLQVHPTTGQAIDGFARGVYPDDRAKPELLCALTPFDALCGVRPVEATLTLLDTIGADGLAQAVRSEGVAATIESIYRGRFDPQPTIVACSRSSRIEAQLVTSLAPRYPSDASAVVTLLLNRVTLQPGEALHLTAGNLHAYLGGAGIELMGASDNVVRGGLTVKHVDIDELLHILDPTPLEQPVMADAATTGRYPLPEAGCTLVRIEAGETHTSAGHELAIGLDGQTLYLPVGATLVPSAVAYVVVLD